MNNGVMKCVGEALQEVHTERYENNCVCIGIIPWDTVTDRDKLRTFGTVEYDISSSFNTEGACLDNNHTHFLLVDQYPTNEAGFCGFRTILEKAIRITKCDGNRSLLNISIKQKYFFYNAS